MAKQKQEEAPKGSPAWMATFSDLMNLLLCFFVLLFSMATVEEEKFQEVVASLQSSFSILPAGGSSVGKGEMISSGVSQLQMFDTYFTSVTDGEDQEYEKEGSDQETEGGIEVSQEDALAAYEEEGTKESEQMAEAIEDQLYKLGIQNEVDVDFNAQYVILTLNGAILFDSGSSELKEEAKPLMDKLGIIVGMYHDNILEIEGHTDNVPIHSAKYESNDVLSMYRALFVADYLRAASDLDPAMIKSSGRGEYIPIGDNSTAEGRARNRRVEIKIFNDLNSKQ